jgi:hypothetical protein
VEFLADAGANQPHLPDAHRRRLCAA